ncbi:hypothetical protein [Bacillus benzoevorans]|uniref:Uncharacterized protein n=1 Tax=Bacillus benzoevorans TaxID=1456 RepID=A0A7X0HUL8_9BACI|nr:hypothetical protein [Bacillus benzoevorans]MBB6447128.1 hypothetical protein [Bacillus benzoevorans]
MARTVRTVAGMSVLNSSVEFVGKIAVVLIKFQEADLIEILYLPSFQQVVVTLLLSLREYNGYYTSSNVDA